jgi:hypothetical protein
MCVLIICPPFLFVAAVAAGLAGDKELSVVTFAIGLPQRFYLVCTCFFQPVDYFISKLPCNPIFTHSKEKKEWAECPLTLYLEFWRAFNTQGCLMYGKKYRLTIPPGETALKNTVNYCIYRD